MMRSVSMSSPRSGKPLPRTWRTRSTAMGHLRGSELAHVDDFAGDRSRRHHRRAHQEGASGGAPLPSLEVPVRRGGADLASFEAIRVHRQAHRAAGAAPFETGLEEHAVEPFAFGGGAHRLRAG